MGKLMVHTTTQQKEAPSVLPSNHQLSCLMVLEFISSVWEDAGLFRPVRCINCKHNDTEDHSVLLIFIGSSSDHPLSALAEISESCNG